MKELLKRLVRAESTAEKGESAAAEVLAAEFSSWGLDSSVETWDGNRANIVAHVRSVGEKPALMFASHLDVVGPGTAEWAHEPFSGFESEGRIYGRGSTDMKGGAAASAFAIKEVLASGAKIRGDIIFAASAGEETDSCGAKRLVGSGRDWPELCGVVIPEPTDFEVITAHRGMLWLEVTSKGRAAHSSTPESGVNAIRSMRAFLDELEAYEIPFEPHERLGGCSMSVNTIAGGKALNVVPDKCTVGIDIRTLPGQDHGEIVADLKAIIDRLSSGEPDFEAQVNVIREVEAMETDCGSSFVKAVCEVVGAGGTKAVGFTTDGPYFSSLGVPVVIFGPGKPDICHKSDEYIEIEDLEKGVEHFKNIILRFLCT